MGLESLPSHLMSYRKEAVINSLRSFLPRFLPVSVSRLWLTPDGSLRSPHGRNDRE